MPRGRPRTPTAVLKLRNSKHAKGRGNEPQPKAAGPELPADLGWLDDEGKAEWNRLAPRLAELGLLTVLDVSSLAAFCQMWAEFVIATRMLNAEGRVLRVPVMGTVRRRNAETGKTERVTEQTGTELVAHPAVKLQRSALAALRSMLGDFGLSPSTRARLNVTPPAEVDEFEEFLNRKPR